MSTTLPWDRFVAPEPAPSSAEPELPYVPPASVLPPPGRTPVATESLNELIQVAARDLLTEAMGYAKASMREIAKGQTVDVLHPKVTATTATGRELVVADAKSRSGRTFVQGLCIDIFAAVIAVIASLSGADPFSRETWILLGALLIKTLIQTAASYVMRLKVTPTIKTEGETLAIMPVPRPIINE